MPWRGTATRRASPPPRSGARAGERGQYRKRAMGKPCVRAQEPLPSHSGFIKAPARSGAFRGPKGKCRHTRLLGVKDAGRAASRRGCRGQGREPGRGERATNSQMNGSNFRCFMEETASRQRDGERREPPRVCKRSHAHTEPARSPGAIGGGLHPPGGHGSFGIVPLVARRAAALHFFLPPVVAIILSSSQDNCRGSKEEI